MDPKRQGEIAVKLVKCIMKKKGVSLGPDYSRELGNIAKTIGVPVDELIEFMRPIMQELLDECLKK